MDEQEKSDKLNIIFQKMIKENELDKPNRNTGETEEEKRKRLNAYQVEYRNRQKEKPRVENIMNNNPIPTDADLDFDKNVFDESQEHIYQKMMDNKDNKIYNKINRKLYTKRKFMDPLDEEELDFDAIPINDDGQPKGGKKKTRRGGKKKSRKTNKTKKNKRKTKKSNK